MVAAGSCVSLLFAAFNPVLIREHRAPVLSRPEQTRVVPPTVSATLIHPVVALPMDPIK